MKKNKVYVYTRNNKGFAEYFHYFVVYLNFVYGSDSLTNLKRKIKEVEKCHGVDIYTMLKDGVLQKEPVFLAHYKPRGIK